MNVTEKLHFKFSTSAAVVQTFLQSEWTSTWFSCNFHSIACYLVNRSNPIHFLCLQWNVIWTFFNDISRGIFSFRTQKNEFKKYRRKRKILKAFIKKMKNRKTFKFQLTFFSFFLHFSFCFATTSASVQTTEVFFKNKISFVD